MTVPTPEQVLEQATQAVNKMLRGKLWQHVKTGGVYLEYGRADHVFDAKAGQELFSGIMGAPLIEATDDIAAGEEFVRYRNVLTGKGWARPARLFDDGRFVPLVLANPTALAEAREREALAGLASSMAADIAYFSCKSSAVWRKEIPKRVHAIRPDSGYCAPISFALRG